MAEIIRLATKIYVKTSESFTKKEYLPSERPKNPNGEPIVWKLGAEHLRNEGFALSLVKENTTIPVPRVIQCGRDDDGVMCLTVEHVDGIVCEEVGQCCRMPPEKAHNTGGACPECQKIGIENSTRFIEKEVLPQLRNLKSDQTGLNGLVLPPPRIQQFDNRPFWTSKKAPKGQQYVFCHGDLSTSNIILDRETLEVKSIIDWECAGYYPLEFERNLWRLSYNKYMETFQDTAKIRDEIALLT